MKKISLDNRRPASSAKFFFAAFCLGLGWCGASLVPSNATLGESWGFRFESFAPFASTARRVEERPLCYLDASGRRVDLRETANASDWEADSAFDGKTEELWATEAAPIGATFGESEPVVSAFDETATFGEPESESVASFFVSDALFNGSANAPLETTNVAWVAPSQADEERVIWAQELKLSAFASPTFTEAQKPGWLDSVAITPASSAELLAFERNSDQNPSAIVSSTLRRLSSSAILPSGDHPVAVTASVSDANAPVPERVASKPTQTLQSTVVPTRVGAFTACETSGSSNVARVRVQ